MNFTEIKVGTRLAIGFSIVLILLMLIAGIGVLRLQHVSGVVHTMVSDIMQKERLFSEWAANTNINGARTIAVAESNDPARQRQVQAKIKETSEKITAIQKTLDTFDKNAEEKALFSTIANKRKTYIAAREEVFKEKLSNEDNARKLIQSKLEPALEDYVDSIKKLLTYQSAAIEKYSEEINQASRNSVLLLLVLGAIATSMGIVIALLITSSIKKQLGGEPAYAVDIANQIASGNLSLSIATRDGDQSSILFAIKSMRDNIGNIVSEVRVGTDTIATASAQIASGNLDLSSRTEEQASSLEETASSMEELIGTVKQNADRANDANKLAVSASAVAIKGGDVVAQVVDTMSSINDSSRKIVDIIGVIDGIAFQTNILALNAAVEAARAGEQGRGFAVVASEVRNLAQRSAGAAKEIKTLIGDSVEKVEQGTKLVDQAGSTMIEIVDSIRRVTDIMGDITSASHEQISGIQQINEAISQMDQVTQQNAALVEEAAAAASSLNDQAVSLSAAVSIFKLDGVNQTAVVQTGRTAVAKSGLVERKPLHLPSRRTGAKKLTAKTSQTNADDWEEF